MVFSKVSLACFVIADVDFPPLLELTRRKFARLGEVVVIERSEFTDYREVEAIIRQKGCGFNYFLVIRLGDELAPEIATYLPDFLASGADELVVNYVLETGFNSVPRKWARRILVTKVQNFRYDGVQIVPGISLRDETELEVYATLGLQLRSQRLRAFHGSNLLITSQIELLDAWQSVHQLSKAREVGETILAKSASPEIRRYVLHQLAQIALHDGNATALEDLLLTYSTEIEDLPLIQAEFYHLTNQPAEVVRTLADYAESDESRTGVPWDLERFRAYPFYLLALAYRELGQTDLAQEAANQFYAHSVVLRFQINYVKALRAALLVSNPTRTTTAPDFLLVSQPRTGSTWTQQQLASHPELTCFGELLALNRPRFGNQKNTRALGTAVLERETNPVGFLSRQFADTSTLVGFKLLLFQLEQYPNYSLWPWLLNNGQTKIVYLKRRHVIAAYVSFLLASNNHYWQTTRPSGQVWDTVTVNLRHFQTYLEKMQAWETKYLAAVPLRALQVIYYEDVVAKGLDATLQFLEVSTQTPLQATTLTQGRLPLELIVTNLDEVKSYYEANPIYK